MVVVSMSLLADVAGWLMGFSPWGFLLPATISGGHDRLQRKTPALG